MNLNVRAYCLVGLGNIKDLTKLLTEISESEVSFVSGTGLVIATFMSSWNISEIEKYLNESEKSYIVFEMTPGFFSANIRDDKFQETLFGGPIENTSFFQNIEDTLSQLKDIDLFNDLQGEEIEDDYMTIMDFMKNNLKKEEEKEPELDEVLDKISRVGFENLSEKEKVFLDNYSKNR
jgi:hypothetical protein